MTSDWLELGGTLDGITLSHRMRDGGRPLLLVHGIGPGTTGDANFGPVLNDLSRRFAPHVIDLVGFGRSGRKPEPPFFDVSLWLRQIDCAIDAIIDRHDQPPVLVGNSVGGALALKAAARRPDIELVMAIGAPVGPPAPDALRAFWKAPHDAASLAAAMRPMTGAAREPDPALVSARLERFLAGDYATYFDAMLADPDSCLARVILQPAEAARIKAKIVLLHGREDRACPVAATIASLLALLPCADVTLLGGCGHNVISERTAEMLASLETLIGKVDLE